MPPVAFSSLPFDHSAKRTEVRLELREALADARRTTDALFALLTAEGLSARPIAERHRFIFYLGHLEAFDWNLVCRDVLGRPSSNEEFERLFAFGIDPLDGNLPRDTPTDWPRIATILAWTRRARADVDAAVDRAPFERLLEDGWALRIAVEHRLMHAETLCYLLQRLDIAFKRPGPLPDPRPTGAAGGTVVVPRGRTTLGLSRAAAPYRGWDNEYERHAVDVDGFAIARLPVSNADWLRFVAADGYRARELWDADAWAWLSREDISAPAFWRRTGDRIEWQGMFGRVPLPMDWPVYVSHAEATAYARWKRGRLPTEAEWHRATFGEHPADAPFVGNFGLQRFEPTASGAHPGAVGPWGVTDLVGNGWEWTSTVFAPFDGFEPLPFYRGYSANFFDGRHFVLKGASPSTHATFLRPSFRNWFQPHYQHVFAKFRLVTEEGIDG